MDDVAAYAHWLDLVRAASRLVASGSAGDLDGDGGVDIVAATLAGFLYSWNSDGTLRPGFPVRTIGRDPGEFDDEHSYDQGFMAAPTIADIDGDGDSEIIVPAMDSRLYVFDGDGGNWGPYPVEICHPDLCGVEGYRIIDSATVGDVDGDGDLDIGFGTNENTLDRGYTISYLLDGPTGEMLDGWP